MLGLWGMWSTQSFLSILDPLWLDLVEPDIVQSIGQIEQFDICTERKQMTH